jgi:phasin
MPPAGRLIWIPINPTRRPASTAPTRFGSENTGKLWLQALRLEPANSSFQDCRGGSRPGMAVIACGDSLLAQIESVGAGGWNNQARIEREQERTMAANRAEQFQVPPEMRALAEKSVEQAKQAIEGFITAAHRTVSVLEGHAETARKGAKDVGGKAMEFAQLNMTSSFDHAQKLVRAKDVQEVLELQAAYIKSQMQVLAEQAKELGQSAGKLAKDPLKSQS